MCFGAQRFDAIAGDRRSSVAIASRAPGGAHPCLEVAEAVEALVVTGSQQVESGVEAVDRAGAVSD